MKTAVDFSGRDVVSIRDFKRDQLESILLSVENLEEHPRSLDDALKGKVAALLTSRSAKPERYGV